MRGGGSYPLRTRCAVPGTDAGGRVRTRQSGTNPQIATVVGRLNYTLDRVRSARCCCNALVAMLLQRSCNAALAAHC
eukprot:2139226-Rhodomonas_salina.1